MDPHSAPQSLTPADAVWARPLIERQLALLGRLAEGGLEVALDIERKIKEGDAGEVQAVAMAYARVSRAVRMTVLLQSKLIQQVQALEAAAADRVADARAEADEDRFEESEGRKLQVERIVKRVARARQDEIDEDELDRILAEAGERLDDDGLYGEVMRRPVSELVADVCRDLGLQPDWPRLSEEAWAKAEIDGGDAGWPLAGFLPPPRAPPPAGEPAQAPPPPS